MNLFREARLLIMRHVYITSRLPAKPANFDNVYSLTSTMTIQKVGVVFTSTEIVS